LLAEPGAIEALIEHAAAKGYDISETHLMKVIHQLGVAGLIDTVRGRKAGCVCTSHRPRSASARWSG